MPLQTFPVPAVGGLNTVLPTQTKAQQPGSAEELVNFEVLPEGGYRKIKGFAKFGDLPDAYDNLPLRGIAIYNGVVVAIGRFLLHSPDGVTWYEVNKKGATDKQNTELVGLELLPRSGNQPVGFETTTKGASDILVITDDQSPIATLKIEGDRYTYTESTESSVSGMPIITRYQDHVVVAGKANDKGKVAVSTRFDPLTFSGQGSWSVTVQDEITGLKTFRDYLYIFCKTSIYRVVNLESKDQVQVRPVTTKIGCIDGRTIQEVGGDILFLARDGLRYLGATERIDDVSLTVSTYSIRDIVDRIDINQGIPASVVIPSQSQYRLFYKDSVGVNRGLIGTIKAEGGFAWSTTTDMGVKFIASDVDKATGAELIYHLGSDKTGNVSVYRHNVGFTFDGSPFEALWATPAFHMGDSAIRKQLHDVMIYIEADELAQIELSVLFDFSSPTVLQPDPFYLEPVVQAARFGEAVYGKGTYGAIRYPTDSMFLEGSGKWIQFIFRDSSPDRNSRYVIRGYDLQFTTGGRV